MLAIADPRWTEAEWLDRFARGGPVRPPVAVVAAHPDDETVSFGAGLRRLENLFLIHVTDGSPHDLSDARRAGFETRIAYAEARRAELEQALRALEVEPRRRLAYLVPDQEASGRMADLARRLAVDLACVDAVISHAFEGGHPDHDACAFAVQAACALIARRGRTPPVRLEFTGCHLADGDLRAGVFRSRPDAPEIALALSDEERAAKRAALERYVSQADTLKTLGAEGERLRLAPDYDFAAGPGEALHERRGRKPLWREQAVAALRELGLR